MTIRRRFLKFAQVNFNLVATENRGYFQKMSEWDFLTLKFSYDYGTSRTTSKRFEK